MTSQFRTHEIRYFLFIGYFYCKETELKRSKTYTKFYHPKFNLDLPFRLIHSLYKVHVYLTHSFTYVCHVKLIDSHVNTSVNTFLCFHFLLSKHLPELTVGLSYLKSYIIFEIIKFWKMLKSIFKWVPLETSSIKTRKFSNLVNPEIQ